MSQSIHNCLQSAVCLLAQEPDRVIIKEVLPDRGYEIKVCLGDYHVILSKLDIIKTLAMSAAGVTENLILHLVVYESDLERGNSPVQ